MSTTSMAIFSNSLFATYSVYACNASYVLALTDAYTLFSRLAVFTLATINNLNVM